MFKNLNDADLRKAIRLTEDRIKEARGIDRDLAVSRLNHLLHEFIVRGMPDDDAAERQAAS